MHFDLNKYFLYYIKMVEISDENLDNIIINPIETNINEEEVIKRGRGRPKKIITIDEENLDNTIKRPRGRPKKIIEEEPPKIGRKKRIITAPWRYKDDGKYITGGFKDKDYHMKYHREYWREHVRVGWTCPYCNSTHVSSEHKKKHWASERCRKIQQEKGILIVETETIQGNL